MNLKLNHKNATLTEVTRKVKRWSKLNFGFRLQEAVKNCIFSFAEA